MEPTEERFDHREKLLKGTSLCQVFQYEIQREDGTIQVLVRQYLNGPHKGTCKAIPSRPPSFGQAEFMGEGNSCEEALWECLNKVKGVRIPSLPADFGDMDPDWSFYDP